MSKKELALIGPQEYAITATEGVMEALKTNLGGDNLLPTDLDTIKMPAAGVTSWTVQTLEGEETEKQLTGIVIWFTNRRAFWKESLDDAGGKSRPDCYSEDGVKGVGDPGGLCKTCPMAEFGSAKGGKGDGQACKAMRYTFMVREKECLPTLIVLSPTSIKPLKNYFRKLGSKGILYYTVESVFELEKAVSKGGKDYSKLVPKFSRKLDDKTIEGVKKYRDEMIPILDTAVTQEVQQTEDQPEE